MVHARVPFQVRFWGVRGSIPSPGPQTRVYGGNTPCVEMRVGDELLIFDLGSGARVLGDSLMARGPVRASIFVSHYHYDHLQGLPFFTPMFSPANAFTVYGATRNGRTVQQILSGQMNQPYFPVTAEMVFRAQLTYQEIHADQELRVGPARVLIQELHHPGGNLGFRVECEGRSVVYATDVEHGNPEKDALFFEFAREADFLIYDAMYTDDEYQGRVGPDRTGWGHSTWQAAVHAADAAKVKRLVLFHHDPSRDDASIERLLEQVRQHRPEAFAAQEAMVIDV